jgi:hypothetical protein
LEKRFKNNINYENDICEDFQNFAVSPRKSSLNKRITEDIKNVQRTTRVEEKRSIEIFENDLMINSPEPLRRRNNYFSEEAEEQDDILVDLED